MINFNAFEIAQEKYKNKEMPFLTKLLNRAKQSKIYNGLKILHNTPLTMEAVLKIAPLVLGGADVTVSCITLLPPQEEALKIIKAANIKLQLEHSFKEDYDIHLDCCGELINNKPPKIGTVELTQTGSEIYKNANTQYPVISVDDSEIKFLETFFGTGDGFVRALHKFVGENMQNQSYVIFGFGKVGKGIVHALKKYTNRIPTVIDIDPSVFNNDAYPNVKFINANQLAEVKAAIKTAYCVITATGVGNVISKYYRFGKNNFSNAILTNMGGSDEYGENFTQKDILFEKKPLNFSIAEPTAAKYLDPVLYAHNFGIDLLLSNKMHEGYNCFPKDVSLEILDNWNEIHHEHVEIAQLRHHTHET